MKSALSTLSEVENGIIYTQHFEEKMNHRYIHDGLVEDMLCFCKPEDIRKVPGTTSRFELRYCLEGNWSMIIVADVFNVNSVILISVFLTGGVGDG